MSGVKHTPVVIATSSAADGVYVISQGEERKAIGTIRAPRSLVDAMCAAPELLEALIALVDRDLTYHGPCIVIPAKNHGDAISIVSRARDAIARARGEQDGGGE